MNNLKVKCPHCGFQYIIPLDRQLVRTLPQNKLYWGFYIRLIADDLGYFSEELHEEFKLMFNPKDSELVPGARVGGSTRNMNRREFSEYLEKIRIWYWQFRGVMLPEPEKVKKIDKEIANETQKTVEKKKEVESGQEF